MMRNHMIRKKTTDYDQISIDQVDYKNLDLLKRHLTETGKIIPSRVSGADVKFQRRLSLAIKQARLMALLPYTDRHSI